MDFTIFEGTDKHGSRAAIAISDETMKEPDFNPEDFFLPGTKDIHKAGEITVDGDTDLLDDYFSVTK